MPGAHRRGRFVQAVIAPEQLVADGDRRHAEHAELVRGVGRGAQCELDLGIAGRLLDGASVQAHVGGGGEHVLRDGEVVPVAKRVAKRLHANSRPRPARDANVAARIANR